MITGMKPRSAAWRAVGSIPTSMAMPAIATAVTPQSRNVIVRGVPSKADMVILSMAARDTEHEQVLLGAIQASTMPCLILFGDANPPPPSREILRGPPNTSRDGTA